MSVFYDLNKTPRNILNQAIVRAIVSENNGALFDPSDLSTLYQDVAGTIPVTAVEQPVGKMLDKSGNGYHATQPITASRPTLSARYNLLTKTEDFSAAVWGSEINLTTTSNTAIAPDGTLTVDTITTTAVTHAKFQVFTCVPNTQYTFSFYAKRGTMTDAKYSVYNLTGAASIVAATSYYSTINADTFSRVSITFTTPENCVSCRVYPLRDSGVVGTVFVWGADVRIGLPGQYQRVNTATDYDTDERYFKKFLRFDGVDDYLNLPYMGLYAGGACSIVAAMSENKVAYGTTLINETNGTLTAPMYNPTRQSDIGNNWRSLIRNDANVVTLSSTGASINADGHISVRSRIESLSNTTALENSINKESYNYTRSGVLTLDKTTIGALLLGGVVGSPNSMNLYGLIITKSALNDAQRVRCERFLARKAGVML